MVSDSPKVAFADGQQELLTEVEAVMAALIRGARMQGPMEEICGYHMATGGRRLRARLSLAAATAMGLDPRKVVGWAAACELLHNATLVHDDVQDGDRTRRGRDCVWVKYGVPQAINCGDLLLMIPFAGIERMDVPGEIKWELGRVLARAAETVVRGQAHEFVMIDSVTSSDLREQYLQMVEGKTSALFSLPIEGAALIAGRGRERADHLGRAAAQVGVVFQICDDLLDFQGRKGRTRPAEDLREGKVSSLLVTYLEEDHEAKVSLKEFLKSPRESLSEDQVQYWYNELKKSHADEKTLLWAKELAAGCKEQLEMYEEHELVAVLDELIKGIMSQVEVKS